MQIRRIIEQNRRPLLMLLFMIGGVLFYSPLAVLDEATNNRLSPMLIFGMLFVTFCRVRLRDLRLSPLHLILVMFQLLASPAVYYLTLPLGEIVAQGAMICVLTPIAMGAVAIGALLGAEVLSIVTYTLVCNIVIAFVAPYYLDIFGNGECDFSQILTHVAPLLLGPLCTAQILKHILPRMAEWIARHSQISFYLWIGSMIITLARTTNFVILTRETIDLTTGITLAGVALVACLFQYGMGRVLGRHFGDRIAGAQSLGQKNTVLAVWLSQSFLFPVSSIAPTAYIIWQNIVNSYQIYQHDRRERRRGAEHDA